MSELPVAETFLSINGEGRRADAPKTGDITLALAAVSLFSAGGLLVLNRKREDEE